MHPYHFAHQYQMIAGALLDYERSLLPGGVPKSAEIQNDFRTGVAFASTEILESYLEDLLNPSCSDEQLHLALCRSLLKPEYMGFIGLCASVALGLGLASQGASFGVALVVTVSFAFPFGVIWHQAPRTALARRLRLARPLAIEVARRRGSDIDQDNFRSARLLERWLGSSASESTPQGAFRGLVH